MRRRTGLIVGGVVLDGFGAMAILVGIELVAIGTSDRCISLYSGCRGDDALTRAGVVTMVAGGALLALGTPLAVMGLRKVPVEAPAPQPAVLVGPGSAALRWRF